MQDTQPPAPAPATETSPASGKENRKKILIILGALVFLSAIGGVSFILGKKTSSTEETALTPTPTPIDTLSPFYESTPTPTPLSVNQETPTVSPTATPTPTPEIKTKIITSEASLDGFRGSNGGGNYGLDIRTGRNLYLVHRGFVSFDLSTLPEGATITEATLRIYQYKTVGDPYGVGGKVVVDHLDYGDSLGNEDYSSAAILSSFVTLTQNDVIEWKDAEVTDRVVDDIDNNRGRSQYRIHHETESAGGSHTGDFAYYESAENNGGTGNSPQLVIKYY